ncbi:hypothetical protein Tco_0216493 [Tanacetum coccineum]
MNTDSSSSSGPLPSNTVANPRGVLKAITTRSGVSYNGPPIPPPFSSLPKVVEREPKVIKDTVQPSTKNIQPLVVQSQVQIDEPVVAPKPKPTIPYPSRANKQKLLVDYVVNPRVPLIIGRPFLRMAHALIDVYGEELTLRVDDEAITFKVGQTSRYSYNDVESVNRIDVIDVSCEEYAQEVLGFLDSSTSGNPTTSLDPILSTSFPSLTPFEGDLLLLELKDLPSRLEYAFLEGTNKLPVIISKELKDEENAALLKVLKSHKWAIAWKISDIKAIDPSFCTHKILMEDDFKPVIQHQRRVNTKIHEVIKKEVIKLFDAELIYPISNSPWVSPVHCVPKKGVMTVVENEDNKLIPTRCMMAIFHDTIEETMEVFMDDFSVFGDSFSSCLSHLHKMLKRCEDTNLVLWEKCRFMVKEGIVLGHKISKSGIKVDKDKVDVIAKLSHPTFVKGVRSFLGHAGFYRRFIQDFSKITRPMTHLLEKSRLRNGHVEVYGYAFWVNQCTSDFHGVNEPDDRGVTEGREDVREVFQQRRSRAKRKLSKCGMNRMGNELILALPEGADDFVVYYDARSKDLESGLEKGEADCLYVATTEGTDKSKIIRKQSKSSKPGHENQKSTKPKPRNVKP